MPEADDVTLNQRQRNELAYHREHARENAAILEEPFAWDVLDHPSRRWWNAYWAMFAWLIDLDLKGKRTLVVGCGFGDDAIRLARLGAEVHAFDLCADSLAIATALAQREGVAPSFAVMPAEALKYDDNFFDVVLARDILHHVDIPQAMAEISRVSKPGAILLVNEIYSHSFTDRIRNSRLTQDWLYPTMQRFVYGGDKPYITEDERKLSETDMQLIVRPLATIERQAWFYFLAKRVFPERYDILAKIDRLLLIALKPLSYLLAGRVMVLGRIQK
jgi:ubiquinone/menaquinone biosynthesis C-methylase UbiE